MDKGDEIPGACSRAGAAAYRGDAGVETTDGRAGGEATGEGGVAGTGDCTVPAGVSEGPRAGIAAAGAGSAASPFSICVSRCSSAYIRRINCAASACAALFTAPTRTYATIASTGTPITKRAATKTNRAAPAGIFERVREN